MAYFKNTAEIGILMFFLQVCEAPRTNGSVEALCWDTKAEDEAEGETPNYLWTVHTLWPLEKTASVAIYNYYRLQTFT